MAPSLTLSPNPIAPGKNIRVEGAGFDPGKRVQIAVNGSGYTTNQQRPAADGSFHCGPFAPSKTGDTTVTARYEGSKAIAAVATIKVAVPPPVVVPTPPVTPPPDPSPAPPLGAIALPASIRTATGDVAAALTAWLMGLPPGATADLSGASLSCSKLHLVARPPLTIFAGALLRNVYGNDQFLLVDGGGSNIVLRLTQLVGKSPNAGLWDPAHEDEHAIGVGGTAGFELDRVTIRAFGGDFVRLDGGVNRWCSSIWIHDSTFDAAGRMAVSFTDGVNGAVIERNTFARVGRIDMDFEPNGYQVGGVLGGSKNVRITDNHFGPKPYGTYPADKTQPEGIVVAITGASLGGRPMPEVSGIVVARNTIEGGDFRIQNSAAPASAIDYSGQAGVVTKW